jgi:chitinase
MRNNNPPDGKNGDQLLNSTVVGIMKTAQNNGKKVILSMGGDAMGGPNTGTWKAFVDASGSAAQAAGNIGQFLDNIKAVQGITLDGIDFDYEPRGSVPADNLQVIVDLTNETRKVLDNWQAGSLLTHAPQPPYICVPDNGCTNVPTKAECDADKSNCAGAGYWYINEYAGHSIDFYFIQYYNNNYWDGVGSNTAIGAHHVAKHVVGLTKGQGGFKGIPVEKIVVGKPACEDCGCGTKILHGCECLTTSDDIIDGILTPIQASLGPGKMPGVGFWQWGGLFGMQNAAPGKRLADKDLFAIGQALGTLPSGATIPTGDTCPSATDKKPCQTGGWGADDTPVYCGGNGDCSYGACLCTDGYWTKNTACDTKGTGTCAAGPNGYTCNGNGTCDYATGSKCSCYCGWTGPDCATPVPPLHCPPSADNQCSGHGTCGDNLNCVCDFGYGGAACDSKLPDVCILDKDKKIVYQCGQFGTCVDDGSGHPMCKCISGWTGGHCEIPPKYPYKQYNYCRRGGDPASCSGHGLCSNQTLDEKGHATGIAPGTKDRVYQTDMVAYADVGNDPTAHCVCESGWKGDWCQIPADAAACTGDADCADTKNMYDIPYSCRDGFCQMPIVTYSDDATLIKPDGLPLYNVPGAATTSNYCDIDENGISSCWGMCGQDNYTMPDGTKWYGGQHLPPGIDGIAAVPAFMFGERKVGSNQTPAGQSNATGAACGTCWKLKGTKGGEATVVIGDRCGGGCSLDKTTREGGIPADPANAVHHDCADFFAGLESPGGIHMMPSAIDPEARQKWIAAGGDKHPDWCAAGSHPHFDLDSTTQKKVCDKTGVENCLLESFEQVPCDAVTGTWPNQCNQDGYWSQNCPV